ncbi:MAG: hypothetical protein KAR35_11310, partial [Candidatus Heimdallarchaeota archaeon]|nr:hypothetical protein [Candidatus Heimdallarchaeota archaeon]
SRTPSRATMNSTRYETAPPLIDLNFEFSFRLRNILIIKGVILLSLIWLVFLSITVGSNYDCIFNADCHPNKDMTIISPFYINRISNYNQSKDLAGMFYVIVLLYSISALLLRSIIHNKERTYSRLSDYDEKIYYVIFVIFLSWMMYTVNDFMIYGSRDPGIKLFTLHEDLFNWFLVQSILWLILIFTDRWVLKQITQSIKYIKSFF